MNKNIITDNFGRSWIEINGCYFIYEKWGREELKDFIEKKFNSYVSKYKIKKILKKLQ